MHLLVVANETVTGRKLIEAVERRKGADDLHVTVVAPVSQPGRSYVVYEDTRRAAAGRRLDRTQSLLREDGIPAHGLVVETDPVTAVQGRTRSARAAGRRDHRGNAPAAEVGLAAQERHRPDHATQRGPSQSSTSSSTSPARRARRTSS